MTETAPLKLIYIAGYGRSGSTLLDISLGEHPDIVGAGEIGEFTRRVWAENHYCSCGSRVHSCPNWKKIFDSWAPEVADPIGEYLREQPGRESIISLRRMFGSKDSRFSSLTRALLEQILRVSQRSVIVDSNKLPGRGFVLAATPGVEVYLVHLVRDPRAVVNSMMKPIKQQVEAGVQKDLKPKPLLHTALRWLVVNLAAEALAARLGPKRTVRVRYEDFVSNPRASLSRVLGLVGRNADGLPDGLSAPFRPQHQVSGSRHRMQKTLLIRTDEAWRSSLSPARQLIVALVCAPLLWRYGYRLRNRVTAPLEQVLA